MIIRYQGRRIAAALMVALLGLAPALGLTGCLTPIAAPIIPPPTPTAIGVGQGQGPSQELTAQGFAPPDIAVFTVTPSDRIAPGQTAHIEWQADADQLVLYVFYLEGAGKLMGGTITPDEMTGSRDFQVQPMPGRDISGVEFQMVAIRTPRDPQTGQPTGEAVTAARSLMIPLQREQTPSPTFPPGVTPTAVPSPTPTPLPTGFPPGAVDTVTITPIMPLRTPAAADDEPHIIRFEVSPNDRLDIGQTATVTWEARADLVAVAYNYVTGTGEQAFGDSVYVDSLKGSRQITLKPVDSMPLYVEFSLMVMNGYRDLQDGQFYITKEYTDTLPVPLKCPYPWFFDNPPVWCPMPPVDEAREAVVQTFENAILVAIENAGAMPHNGVTVLYTTDQFWTSFSVVEPLTPNVPPSLSGTLVPDPAFYGLWLNGAYRVEPLKNSVGDPVGEAVHFQAHRQCELSPSYPMATECFINLPPDKVIRLYTHSAYGRNGMAWSEWTGPTP